MSRAETCDLTTIPPGIFSDEWSKLNLYNDKQRFLDSCLQRRYVKQKRISDDLFHEWFHRSNAELVKEIQNFVESRDRVNYLIKNYHMNVVHAAAVNLGMQNSDHLHTIDMIEDELSNRCENLTIIRIDPSITKRQNLLDVLQEGCDQKRLLVMVEQTDTLSQTLIVYLVNFLHGLLSSGKTRQVAVLFFMSCSLNYLNLTSPDTTRRLGPITTIVKQSSDMVLDVRRILLDTKDITFRLGPRLIDAIYENFIERDASIMNLKYLYQYSLFQHYSQKASLLTHPKADLLKIIQSHPQLIPYIRNLNSVKSNSNSIEIDWNNNNDVVDYCERCVRVLTQYHEFIWSQLYYYLDLLIDETGNSFPTDLGDIHLELSRYIDLGESVRFIDAIFKLRSFPIDRILKRIERGLERSNGSTRKVKGRKDVRSILAKFKNKFDNNSDCQEMVTDFTNELREHSQLLENPLKMPLSEAIYYNDTSSLKARLLPSTRFDASRSYADCSSDFGILYGLIQAGAEEMNACDLFEDFRQALGEHQKQIKRLKAEQEVSKAPARATRSSDIAAKPARDPEVEEISDVGLQKAVFIDLLNCMSHQGIIKIDGRESKKGVVRKIAWLG